MDEIISDSGYPDIETAIIGLRGSDNTIDHQLDAKIAELVNNHDDIILEGNAPWLAVKKTSTRKSIDILVDCDHNIRLRRVARKLGISEPVAGAFLNTVERNTHERLCKHYSQQFIHFEKFADMLVHTHFSLPGVVAAGIVIQFKLAQQIAS
jgi:cytidylate kinase